MVLYYQKLTKHQLKLQKILLIISALNSLSPKTIDMANEKMSKREPITKKVLGEPAKFRG